VDVLRICRSAQLERSGFPARRGLRWRTSRAFICRCRSPPARKDTWWLPEVDAGAAINCASSASCIARKILTEGRNSFAVRAAVQPSAAVKREEEEDWGR
jgi:hypothetical protein